jgi:polyphenol oxidase
MNGTDFCRKVVNDIPFYSCRAFDRHGWVRHGFSTRNSQAGPMSLGPMIGEAREEVANNRRLFLEAIGLHSMPLATLSQVHSDRVQVFEESDLDLASQREGDAITTRRRNIAIAVQIADCFPVLAVDTVSGAIAAIHSGWRGTVARVLRRTLEEMFRSFGTDPSALLIAIGPGIRDCCMQIGAEVALKFEAAYPGRQIVLPQPRCEGKYLAGLPRALEIQCQEAGVPAGQVFDLGACTLCRPDEFFSYRADDRASGRMMAAIGRLDSR